MIQGFKVERSNRGWEVWTIGNSLVDETVWNFAGCWPYLSDALDWLKKMFSY